MHKIFLYFSFIILPFAIKAQETITISGRLTDFDGNPIDSSIVRLNYPDFSTAYHTYTDKDGNYTLKGVKKGKYTSLYVIRPKEYPRENAVPEENMKLEFWGWNIIADRDLIINPRYQELELYGTTAYRIFGGYNGFFIYFRPMSLKKYLSYEKELYLNKEKMEEINADLSVLPEYLDVKVFAEEEELKINSITPIEEYVGGYTMRAFIVQVDAPKQKPAKPYIIFRVEAENKEYNEKGENIYFYEIPTFNQKIK